MNHTEIKKLDRNDDTTGKYIPIDCGIGIIWYLEPKNIKLQCKMEDFKEKLEKEALFGKGV